MHSSLIGQAVDRGPISVQISALAASQLSAQLLSIQIVPQSLESIVNLAEAADKFTAECVRWAVHKILTLIGKLMHFQNAWDHHIIGD